MILVYGVLLALILTVGTLLFRQWAQQAGPVRTRQVLRRSGFALLAGLVAILLLRSGAVLLALLTALLPLLRRLLPWLLTLLPLFRQYGHVAGSGSVGGATASAPGQSTVNTRFLSMTLDHRDGRMNGRVLEGPYQGRELDDLSLPELMDLHRYCQADPQSSAVLQAYLDRARPDWRHHASESDTSGSGGGDYRMSVGEARAILGVSADATREEIIRAHRRLMQKFHPDRGGNDFLAARINEAKSVLLGD